jgi:hypothetical protein
MNKKQFIGITVLITMVVVGVAYIYLGGLNKVTYSVVDVKDYNMVGRHYQGDGDGNDLEAYFFEAKSLLNDGRLSGTLTLVHYNDTSLAEDEVKLFVGVLLDEGIDVLPTDYDRLTIPARRAMRATIEAHNIVMPSPQTIETTLREKAAEYSVRLQDFTIEQYLGERDLLIDMPAR